MNWSFGTCTPVTSRVGSYELSVLVAFSAGATSIFTGVTSKVGGLWLWVPALGT